MSHTSQRRGLGPERPGREMIVLAMIPSEYTDKSGIRSAMRELALKVLAHNPSNWLSRNYIEIAIPQLQPVHGALEWLHGHWPEAIERLLLGAVATRTPVITAVYTDMKDVVDLIDDLKGDWLRNNQENGYPISIVLSGLFDDVHRCCQRTGSRESRASSPGALHACRSRYRPPRVVRAVRGRRTRGVSRRLASPREDLAALVRRRRASGYRCW